MKNSVWREYQNGVYYRNVIRERLDLAGAIERTHTLEQLEERTGRELPADRRPEDPPAEKRDPVLPWRCGWCSKPNPVGAQICESCGMVRVE